MHVMNIQIRDVPDTLHAELRRRAKQCGQSLNEYLNSLLLRHVELPSRDEWLRELKKSNSIEGGIRTLELLDATREQYGKKSRGPVRRKRK